MKLSYKNINAAKLNLNYPSQLFINGKYQKSITEKSFDNISSYIDFVKLQEDAEIIIGGNCDKTNGYFVEPTVIVTTNPKFDRFEKSNLGKSNIFFSQYPLNHFSA